MRKKNNKSECIYCKYLKETNKKYLISKNNVSVAFLDNNFENNYKIIIIPLTHCYSFTLCNQVILKGMFSILKYTISILEKKDIKNYYILINEGNVAGQKIGHFSIEIILNIYEINKARINIENKYLNSDFLSIAEIIKKAKY